MGASLLAKDFNDNAWHQAARVVHTFFASMLAPTRNWGISAKVRSPPIRTYRRSHPEAMTDVRIPEASS
ncbi:hypothetical protein DM828_02465 [Pseudomonas umsongensis]|nr:hypothetical protein [Pseudomonas umsongensis]